MKDGRDRSTGSVEVCNAVRTHIANQPIDKEQPLAGAVICFTAVSLEYRVCLMRVRSLGKIEEQD